MSLYAAYAGNLDARLMARRAPHSPLRCTGWLTGWRLTFGGEHMGWDGALATIVESPAAASGGAGGPGTPGAPPFSRSSRISGAWETSEVPEVSEVFVALYDVAPMDEESLDRWEGVGMSIYRRTRIRVHTLDGDLPAWTYVLNGYEGGLPSARYLGQVADAAESAGAPHDYVLELRKRPC